jgi:hypothetical protein
MQETRAQKRIRPIREMNSVKTLPFLGLFAPDVTLFNDLNHYLIMDKGPDRADAFLRVSAKIGEPFSSRFGPHA